MKRAIVALLLVSIIGAGARAYYVARKPEPPSVTTAALSRGSVVSTVSATGTLQAVTTVQVGTQVSGTIAWLGADFNSIVHKGEVIAKLDTSLLDADVEQAQAAEARARADVENARVQLDDAHQKFARSQELAKKQLVPQSDFDAARVAVGTAEAQLKSSQAQLTQAQASLGQAHVTREHAIITAPIDGIVIERSVDVGQTVAASLQSPTIFQIAADLTKMQVNADIDESDIGAIAAGQRTTFTVDAYPGETFAGSMMQVRLQPTVVQNVTTYSAIISVANPDLKLKPGMTANVKVETGRRDDVLRAPSAALRFTPTSDTLAALHAAAPADTSRGQKRVWVADGDGLRPVAVTAGLSDGQLTEISGDGLQPGARVVTSVSSTSAPVRSASTSPLPLGALTPGPPGPRTGSTNARGR
ncbi:MAG TPA: efflux RND transporter periplasmic adaptor subunit [Vicinamibacterales bacterium]|jgi:HlyD family secretion protein